MCSATFLPLTGGIELSGSGTPLPVAVLFVLAGMSKQQHIALHVLAAVAKAPNPWGELEDLQLCKGHTQAKLLQYSGRV